MMRSRTPSPQVFENTFSDFDDDSDTDNPTINTAKQANNDTVSKANPSDSNLTNKINNTVKKGIVNPNFVSRQYSNEKERPVENDTRVVKEDGTGTRENVNEAHKESRKDGIKTSSVRVNGTDTRPESPTVNNGTSTVNNVSNNTVHNSADNDSLREWINTDERYKRWIKTWTSGEDDFPDEDRFTDTTIRIDPMLTESAGIRSTPPKPRWAKYQKFPRVYHTRSSRITLDEAQTKAKSLAAGTMMSPINILSKIAEESGRKDLSGFLEECDKMGGFLGQKAYRFPCMQCYEKQGTVGKGADPFEYMFWGSADGYYYDYDSESEGKCTKCGGKVATMGSFVKMLTRLKAVIQANDLLVHDVYPDGNCLFGAVVDQLRVRGVFAYTVHNLRKSSVQYLRKNPMSSDGETHFELFLTDETWDEYLTRMSKDGEWGDHMILSAIANVTHQKIVIFGGRSGEGQTVILPIDMQEPVAKEPEEPKEMKSDDEDEPGDVDGKTDKDEEKKQPESSDTKDEEKEAEPPVIQIFDKKGTIFLAHFGESHYVSLRPKDWRENLLNPDKEQEDTVARKINPTPKKKTFPLEHLNFFLLQFLQFEYVMSAKSKYIDNPTVDFNEAKDEVIGSSINELAPRFDEVKLSAPDVGIFLPADKNKPEESNMQEQGITLHVPKDTVVTTDVDVAGRFDLIAEVQNDSVDQVRLIPRRPNKWQGQTEKIGDSEYLSAMNPFPGKRKLLAFSMAWPLAARSWRKRDREALWPDVLTVERIEDEGVHVVPVIYTTEMSDLSDNYGTWAPEQTLNPLIWAVTFAVAEREISRCITPSQRNVFCLFERLIHYALQSTLFPKIACKHVFLYACENTTRATWDQQPGVCLLTLLNKVSVALSSGFIPHYFLPSKNLLQTMSTEDLQICSDKVDFLRHRPMVALYFLLDRHKVTETEIGPFIEDLVEDTQQFKLHHDIQRSTLEGFLPASCNLLESFIYQAEYEFALNVILCIRDKLAIACPDGGPGLADIVNKGLWNMIIGYRWCMAFYIDIKQNTAIAKATTAGIATVSIMEMFGPEIVSLLPDTRVPKVYMHQGGELNFPSEIVKVLKSAQKMLALSKCLRYYLDTYYDCFGTSKESPISSTIAWYQTHLYVSLFECYKAIDEKEEFRDLLPRLADSVSGLYNYESFKQKVVDIYRELGEHKLARKFQYEKRRPRARPSKLLFSFVPVIYKDTEVDDVDGSPHKHQF